MDAEAPLEDTNDEEMRDVFDEVLAMRNHLAANPKLAADLLSFMSAQEDEHRKRLEQHFGQPAFA